MNNNNLILFILVICVIYLLYKVNKKENFTNNATDAETITITESIKNLGLIAQEIQKGGSYRFPGNVIVPGNLSVTGNITIPLGGKIILEGPGGKFSEMFFNTGADGLEIAQRGASKLRLFQNSSGFDFTHDSITNFGSSKLRLNNDIFTTGKVVADGSVDTKTKLRLIDANSTYKGGVYDKDNQTYIDSRYGGIRGINKDDFDWLIPFVN